MSIVKLYIKDDAKYENAVEKSRKYATDYMNRGTKTTQMRLNVSDNAAWLRDFYGKMAEFHISIQLERAGKGLCEPDTTIWSRGTNKIKMPADLVYPNFDVHIKSQTPEMAGRYGSSWMMNRRDIDEVFKDSDYFFLTEIDPDKPREMIIRWWGKWGDLKGKLDECKAPRYQETSRCIYLKNL